MEEQGVVNEKKKKVLIVDDHPIVRFGLRQLIDQDKDFYVCGEADNAHKALRAIEELRPDIAIIDVSLRGKSGIELIKCIKISHPNLLVMALSIHDETIYAERALRAGAKGYIMKQEACERVIAGLHQVLCGGIFVSQRITTKIMDKYIDKRSSQCDSPLDILSDRELEVFRLIGQGYGTRQIANELVLGIKTIETHRAHIKDKLKLRNSSELVQYAVRWCQIMLSA